MKIEFTTSTGKYLAEEELAEASTYYRAAVIAEALKDSYPKTFKTDGQAMDAGYEVCRTMQRYNMTADEAIARFMKGL